MIHPQETGAPRRRALSASQGLLEGLIDGLPVGVVLLDREGKVVLFNAYEERLALRRREDVIGRSFFEVVAPCTNVRELGGAFREKAAAGALDERVDFRFKLEYLPRPRDVRIVLRSFTLGDEPFAAFVVEDVTERRRLERERDEFYSILVHDLRGDLSGVLGYASLLADGSFGPVTDRQKEAALLVREAGGRMNDKIAAALREHRARQEGGALHRREPVNMHALVLSTLALARPGAGARGVRLVYEGAAEGEEFPERAVATLGDVDRLGALVDNLVTNAVKYARGLVVIALDEEGDEVRLRVRDDGPGIAEAYRERVFEGRFQAPGSLPGHGLGLYSVRQTAAAHGGRAWAGAAPEGGAALEVALPRLRLE
ncbi:MAG: PAS domain-containing protein [Planctomycetes bacterium]|nr:PAS domain-containing protein [Planctomycetota bacterium]